ncbi:S4 domain-containing protein, partial [Pseudomonas sp. 2995-3]|uniref:S4 domain-containing protein n=1 Tax=Pseudomonas sp. 2995-3 TaxID=1712680 RepID=UPI002114D6F3
MRINKYLSTSGKTSRRGADKLIEAGKVTINGKPAEIGSQVEPGDDVRLNGEPVRVARENVYIA